MHSLISHLKPYSLLLFLLVWGLYSSYDYTNSRIYRFIETRLNKRDCKIIITSRNSETGTGKTTLALILAKVHDRIGWNVNKQFHSGFDYADYYDHAKKGEVLVVDDFQFSADSRRGTSNINVILSQYWAIMRTKNVLSIVTLPTSSMLDKRFLELADIRINIVELGKAYPYRIVVNDFSHKVKQYRWKDRNNNAETIYFTSIDDDNDFQKTIERKDKFVRAKLKEWKKNR